MLKSVKKLRTLARNMSKQEVFDPKCSLICHYADEIEHELAERYMELPVDADGVPIRVGGVLDPPADCDDYVPLQVVRLMYDGYEQEWFFDGEAGGFCGMVGEHMDVAGWTHHHAPTVEDVLREFALAVCKDDALTIRKDVVDEYAAKLQLREDA